MQTVQHVQTAWAALDRQSKIEAWADFTRSVDYGDQGYDPFYLVLWPLFEAGSSPFMDDDRSGAEAMIEAFIQKNEYFDAMIRAGGEDGSRDGFSEDAAYSIIECPF